jgi:hypothetical protein
MSYAFGLMPGSYRGLATVDHGGSFIGFRAQLLRFPAEQLSVAVLCNDGSANPERMARQVAELYLGDRMTPAAATTAPASTNAPSVPAERLERWVGSYQVTPGTVARVTRDSAGLWVAVFGQRIRLVPRSDSVFTASGLGDFEFRTGPSLLVAGSGATTPAPRLGPAPVLSATELAGYRGRYRSDELDTWASLEARGDTLRIRVRWGPWRALAPIGPDSFTMPGTQVAFDRGRRGEITGFRLSAARTLNVSFAREPDRR